jgi:hypothetical protein
MKKYFLPLVFITLFALFFLCDKQNNTLSPNPKDPTVNLPDSLPSVSIPDNNPLPILTVGSGSASSITMESLEQAADSLYRGKHGGTICFASGSEPVVIAVTRPLRVQAPDTPLVIDGGNVVTLDGRNTARIISCSNYARLVLKNISLINGRCDSSGAAVLHPWFGTLACSGVTFSGNECTLRGPEFGGGAVFAGGLDRCIFCRCVFINNRASNGGAVLNRGGNLVIDSCRFENNTATGDAGGKDAGAQGKGGLGGAVYIDGMNYDQAQPFDLKATTFIGNVSHCHGSAVFAYYYKNKPGISGAVVHGCSFTRNIDSGSTTSAGTLYHEGAPLKLHACTFASNTTLKHAGAIFLGPDATSEIVNCTFYGNFTPGNGGAIFGGDQRMLLWNCTFYQNTASYGPALYNDEPEAVKVYNTLFVENIPIINQYAYRNCTATYLTGANVFQWPPTKANGNPDNPCIPDARFSDPMLESLTGNGGPTQTMALSDGSPALGVCDSCPPVDQRGMPRSRPCDAGAYEK